MRGRSEVGEASEGQVRRWGAGPAAASNASWQGGRSEGSHALALASQPADTIMQPASAALTLMKGSRSTSSTPPRSYSAGPPCRKMRCSPPATLGTSTASSTKRSWPAGGAQGGGGGWQGSAD